MAKLTRCFMYDIDYDTCWNSAGTFCEECPRLILEPGTKKDNLVNFINLLDDAQRKCLMDVLNNNASLDLHLGKLPFVSRKVALEALYDESDRSKQEAGCDNPIVDSIIKKLTINEWVDITTTGDQYRKFLHIITGEIRRDNKPLEFNADDCVLR